MTSTCELAIIINSYNRLPLLRDCLAALAEWLPGSRFCDSHLVVVYDAGSSDGSIAWLMADSLKSALSVELIQALEGAANSFADGINAGVTHALSRFPSIQYLMFYETDNLVLDGKPLQQAVRLLDNVDKLAACGFTVRKLDGRPAGVGQPFPSLLNFALGKQLVERFQLEEIPYYWEEIVPGCQCSRVDVVYTSPLLVRVDAWLETGGLDADRFPFADCDVDWARRLDKLGWRSAVVKTSEVIHDNRQLLSAWSEARTLQSHAGRLQYFKRHHPLTVYFIWPFVLLLRHFAEWSGTLLFVRRQPRRSQLHAQAARLIRDCFRSYQPR